MFLLKCHKLESVFLALSTTIGAVPQVMTNMHTIDKACKTIDFKMSDERFLVSHILLCVTVGQ